MASKRSDRGRTSPSPRAREATKRARPSHRPTYKRTPTEKAEQMTAFLDEYRQRGNVRAACRMAGIDRTTAYAWRQENETFRELWINAREEATDLLEEEARRRGHDGIDKPIYYKGKKVDVIKEYSDRMLEILLKANRKKFRDKVELTGEDGGPINVVKRIERVIVKPGAKK